MHHLFTQSGIFVLQILKHVQKHFLAGHGFLATVLGVETEGLIHLSLTGQWMCSIIIGVVLYCIFLFPFYLLTGKTLMGKAVILLLLLLLLLSLSNVVLLSSDRQDSYLILF